jgi:hypothetical protein
MSSTPNDDPFISNPSETSDDTELFRSMTDSEKELLARYINGKVDPEVLPDNSNEYCEIKSRAVQLAESLGLIIPTHYKQNNDPNYVDDLDIKYLHLIRSGRESEAAYDELGVSGTDLQVMNIVEPVIEIQQAWFEGDELLAIEKRNHLYAQVIETEYLTENQRLDWLNFINGSLKDSVGVLDLTPETLARITQTERLHNKNMEIYLQISAWLSDYIFNKYGNNQYANSLVTLIIAGAELRLAERCKQKNAIPGIDYNENDGLEERFQNLLNAAKLYAGAIEMEDHTIGYMIKIAIGTFEKYGYVAIID